MIDEDSKGNNMENLKQAVIDNLSRRQIEHPKDKFLACGKMYTQPELIKEIEADSALGVEMVNDTVLLTIDLLGRDKIKPTGKPKSFGITVWLTWRGKWWASCEYHHPDNKKVKVVTVVQIAQSCNTITLAIDTILTESKRLGIEFVPYLDEATPHLSLDNDENASGLIGDGWRQLIRDEAARIGFGCRYDEAGSWYHEVGAEPEPERVAVDDDEVDFLEM